MNVDTNVLFGVYALQQGLIDAQQFLDACSHWNRRKDVPLADILLASGLLDPADKARVDSLLAHRPTLSGTDRSGAIFRESGDEAPSSWPHINGSANPEFYSGSAGGGVGISRSRYSFTSIHGVGGMGRVWRARDNDLLRDVALKELRPDAAETPGVRARFLREAQITGGLEHPGIVPVYELGRNHVTGRPFYTMRFVKGRTLSEAAEEFHRKRLLGRADRLELAKLLSAFVAVCNTLAYAHTHRVLHRDLKGQNVVLGDFGEVIVLDWGLAKLVDDADEPVDEAPMPVDMPMSPRSLQDTREGDVMGSPGFMAPEQAIGRQDLINFHTDIYGLGAVLYEILTGRPPISGSNADEVASKTMEGALIAPQEVWPGVPSALAAACLKALAKDPAARFASAAAFAEAIEGWQEKQRRRAENLLRRQKEILRTILDKMSEAVLVANDKGRLLHINPAAERLIGVSADDRTIDDAGRRFEFFFPDGVTPIPADQHPLARAVRGEEIEDAEIFIRLPGVAEGVWASANARPLQDETGALKGGMVVYRNITERKHNQEALSRSHALLQGVTEGTTDAVFVKDLAGRYLMLNSAAAQFMGKPAEEIVGKGDDEYFSAESARFLREKDQRVLASGKTQTEEEDVTAAGVRRTYLATKGPYRDGDGNVVGLIGISRDITERKQMEKDLQLARERLELAFLGTQDGLWDWNMKTDEIYFSPRWKALLGCRDDEISNHYFEWEERLHPDDRERALKMIEDYVTGVSQVNSLQHRLRHKNGSYRWVVSRGFVLRAPGGSPYRMVGSSYDVTERNAAEDGVKERDEQHHDVLAALPVGVAVIEADGRVQTWNRPTERLLQISAEQIRLTRFLDLGERIFNAEGLPIAHNETPVQQTLRTGLACVGVILGAADGKGGATWMRATSQPLFRSVGATPYAVVLSLEELPEKPSSPTVVNAVAAEAK